MKYKLNKYVLGIFVFTTLLTGCDKNEDQFASIEPQKNEVGYLVRDGYLAFDSRESFRKSINKIVNQSEIERNKWEQKIGFVSQQRIAENVINEELKKDSINRIKFADTDLSPSKNTDYNSEAFKKALSLVSKSDLHSNAYYEALSKGVIKLIDEGTENEYWDFSVFSSCYVNFINEDGLYAVADTLYQVTNNGIKAIKYSDSSSKITILNVTKPSNNVKFRSPIQKVNSPGVFSSPWVQSTSWLLKKRIRISVELTLQYLIVSTLNYEFFHRVHSECQGQNILGTWIYDDCGTVKIDGSWEISMYRYPQLYSSSYSFTGNDANNYFFSVSPGSGALAYYESYFVVQPNSANFDYGNGWPERQLAYQPYFTHCNWTANRADEGLTAVIHNPY